MYSDLLRAAMRELADDTLPVALVHGAPHCQPSDDRRCTAGRRAGGGGEDTYGAIAREIEYDVTLIRLCRSRGISCDPAGFARPIDERDRLERALLSEGLGDGP